MIEGIDTKEIDIKELNRKLKVALACGGTAKEGKIDLQGDHLIDNGKKLKSILLEAGFQPEAIEISLQIV